MNKVKSTNNFDAIAPFYDFLAKFVFGDTIHKAQTEYLHLINPNHKVLILGGGTGWIIEEILDRQPKAKITYIEKSSQMIALAKKANLNPTIKFFNCSFEAWKSEEKFDFVISNFFLDVFQKPKLEEQIIPKIRTMLATKGRLLVADFQNGPSKGQKILLWVMHKFFALSSNMESSKLIDLNALLVINGFKETSASFFFKKMIFSRVYEP